MIEEVRSLLDRHFQWLKEQTVVREVGAWAEITTPYLDRHNDCLQIYARRQNGGYLLTDDGYILEDLEHSGCRLDSPKRQALLQMTLRGFGVELEDNALQIHATQQNFPLKKHNLVQAMLAVNDLFCLATPAITSLFYEDVVAWLEESGIRYTPQFNVIGRSGYTHHFDFVVPKSRTRPERILRAINRPNRDAAESMIFDWNDTREVRPAEAQAYALLNDGERAVPGGVVDALSTYGIKPVVWGRREEVREELAA